MNLGWKSIVVIAIAILGGLFLVAAYLPNVLGNSIGSTLSALFDNMGNAFKTTFSDPIYTMFKTNIGDPIYTAFDTYITQPIMDSVTVIQTGLGNLQTNFNAWTASIPETLDAHWTSFTTAVNDASTSFWSLFGITWG